MKSPQRIDNIARYIADDFINKVEPMGFKAFVVAVDREACVLYKRALEKYLPPDWIEAVYSSFNEDKGDLKKLALKPEAEKTIRRDFLKKEKLPKILIVTEKLLTGYDAPILYCMYLDKPMRDHVLLQAIARVNRPYEDDDIPVKPCGFVLDFVGIFERLERALAFDSDVVSGVIENIDTLKQLFATWMKEQAAQYLPYTRLDDDKAIDRTYSYFLEDKQRREAFLTFFRRLQNLYDVLSPSPFLRPYLDNYQALAALYLLVRRDIDAAMADKELTRKTRELLRANTSSSDLGEAGAIREIGPEQLAALKQSNASDTVKMLNLRKLLNIVVEEQAKQEPYLIPIGERADAVAQEYEERHITTRKALEDYETLLEKYVNAREESTQLGLDRNGFAIYIELKQRFSNISAQQAAVINQAFARYPDYQWNEKQNKLLHADLYKLLYPLCGVVKSSVEMAEKLIKLERV